MEPMQFWIGVTDNDWFRHLASISPDEVAFWHPSGQGFGAIQPGAPFLFKLKKPNNHIAGGGNFSINSKKINLRTAWDAFREKIGAATFEGFQGQIASARGETSGPGYDPEIGLSVISEPFFFPREQWIDAPSDWASGIQKGKTYSMVVEPGRTIWREVRARIEQLPETRSEYVARESTGSGQTLGNEYLRRARVGQGAFRVMTIQNFRHKCCITGETTGPVLQAAHINPVSQDGRHSIRNGLLLRADLHILFDRGLIGIDPAYRIRISPQIRNQYLNGRVYYAHDGEGLRSLPTNADLRPDPKLLEWHMDTVFNK